MRIEALGGPSELQQELDDAFTGESPTDFFFAYIEAAQELAIGLKPGDELSVIVTFKNIDGQFQSLVRMDALEHVKKYLIAIDGLGNRVAS
jgi:hypothetical protein